MVKIKTVAFFDGCLRKNMYFCISTKQKQNK